MHVPVFLEVLWEDMCLTFGPRSVGCKVEISNHIEAVKDADRRR